MSIMNDLNAYTERFVPTYRALEKYVASPTGAESIAKGLFWLFIVNFFYSLDQIDLTETFLSGAVIYLLQRCHPIVCYSPGLKKGIKTIEDSPDKLGQRVTGALINNTEDLLKIISGLFELTVQWNQKRNEIERLMWMATSISKKEKLRKLLEEELKKRDDAYQKIQQVLLRVKYFKNRLQSEKG